MNLRQESSSSRVFASLVLLAVVGTTVLPSISWRDEASAKKAPGSQIILLADGPGQPPPIQTQPPKAV
jgi:hypothetical protein